MAQNRCKYGEVVRVGQEITPATYSLDAFAGSHLKEPGLEGIGILRGERDKAATDPTCLAALFRGEVQHAAGAVVAGHNAGVRHEVGDLAAVHNNRWACLAPDSPLDPIIGRTGPLWRPKASPSSSSVERGRSTQEGG